MSRQEEHKKDLLKSWLHGNANLKEEQQLEQLAADDPFLAEALEGYRSMPEADHSANIQSLKNRLNNKNQRRSTIIPIYLMRIAAGAAILVVSIIAFQWINGTSEASMADNMTTAKEEQTAVPEKQIAIEGDLSEDDDNTIGNTTVDLNDSHFLNNNDHSNSGDPLNVKPKLFVEKKEAIDIHEEEGFIPADEEIASLEDDAMAAIEEAEPAPVISPKIKGSKSSRNSKIAKDIASSPIPTVPLDILPDSNTVYVLNGRVENELGEPLIGATVSLVNTTKNTITDFNGDFKISMQDTQRGQIQINYTGYEPQTVAANEQNNLKVTLRTAQNLSEVSVADYAIKEDKISSKKKRSKTAEFFDKKAPEPINGFDNYKLYVQKELNYPSLAKENNIQGIVRVEFTVDGSGKPTNFKILKTLGFGCDAEAMFLLENGPRWSHPGKAVYEIEFKL